MKVSRIILKLEFQNALKNLIENKDLTTLSGHTTAILYKYIKEFRHDPEALNERRTVQKGIGETLLITLIEKDYEEILKFLLFDADGAEATKDIVNTPGAHGRTPLATACLKGSYKCVELLLKHPQIKINDVGADDSFHRTPLFFAAIHGYVEIVDLLLQKGANKEIDRTHIFQCIKNDIEPLKFQWWMINNEWRCIKEELENDCTELEKIQKEKDLFNKDLERYDKELEILNLLIVRHMLEEDRLWLFEAKEKAIKTLREIGIEFKNPEIEILPFQYIERQMSGKRTEAPVQLGSRIIPQEQKIPLTVETNTPLPITPISTDSPTVVTSPSRPFGLPGYGTLAPFGIKPQSQNHPWWEVSPSTPVSTSTSPCGTPRSSVIFHIPPSPPLSPSRNPSMASFASYSPVVSAPSSPQLSARSGSNSLLPLSPQVSFSSCASSNPLVPEWSFSSCTSRDPLSPLPPSVASANGSLGNHPSTVFGKQLSPIKELPEHQSPLKPPQVIRKKVFGGSKLSFD